MERKFTERAHELSQSWVMALYVDFGRFFANGERRQNYKIHLVKYLDFFKLIDKRCAHEQELNLYKLFSLFGAQWARKYFVARSFFISIGKIPPLDDIEHEELKNFFKLQKLLEQGFGKWFHPLLMAFYKNQQEVRRRYRERGWTGKDARYLQRSIRLSLMTAFKFLAFIEKEVNKAEDINQLLLDEFFFSYPGYRASIRPFIRYLRKRKITRGKISVVRVALNSVSDREIGSAKYVQLLDECLNPLPGKAKNALFVLFALLYAQRPKQINRLLLTDVIEEEDGSYSVVFDKVALPMDEEVNPVMRQYLIERKSTKRNAKEENLFLFPGRTAKSPVSDGTITHTLKKVYGTGSSETFPTALLQAYRSGMQNPAVVRAAFGVTGFTAVKYMHAANVRLRNEINEIRKNSKEDKS